MIIDKKPKCESVNFSGNLKDWLETQAQEYELKYLLAHADDGVIWGKFSNNELVTSQEAFPDLAELRLCTLQQCRIFGEKAEVRLWKAGQNWKARLIEDGNLLPEDKNLSPEDYICEKQILWGTKLEGEPKKGFTLVSDGSEGLRHAVPLTLTKENFKGNNYRPLRLEVRHYIDYDQETGVARIHLSRVVNLFCDS